MTFKTLENQNLTYLDLKPLFELRKTLNKPKLCTNFDLSLKCWPNFDFNWQVNNNKNRLLLLIRRVIATQAADMDAVREKRQFFESMNDLAEINASYDYDQSLQRTPAFNFMENGRFLFNIQTVTTTTTLSSSVVVSSLLTCAPTSGAALPTC